MPIQVQGEKDEKKNNRQTKYQNKYNILVRELQS